MLEAIQNTSWTLGFEELRKRRLDRTKKMLKELRSASDKVSISSDEQMFTMEPQVDAKHDNIMAATAPSVDPPVTASFAARDMQESWRGLP